MSSNNIYVHSHLEFDKLMEDMKLDDSNVENVKDTAFISIVGSVPCLINYLNEPNTKHYFNENHSNVLNLDFDDIGEDYIIFKGQKFFGLSDEQAEILFNFIDDNLKNGAKNFHIHCRAGVSRSAACGVFIYDMYRNLYDDDSLHLKYTRDSINQGVIRKLKKEYYKKYQLFNEV